MNLKKLLLFSTLVLVIACQKTDQVVPAKSKIANMRISATPIGVNVLVNRVIDENMLAQLKTFGRIVKVYNELNALSIAVNAQDLINLKSLSFVIDAQPDAERNTGPVEAVAATDFSEGLQTWNMDAINTMEAGVRTVPQTGEGVYVAVLDTGLPDSWRNLFPAERIATQYAKSFGGGGGEVGNVSEQPNKWEHDQNGHGGHVTSTIIGYKLFNQNINGVAPKATIIPVKVLGQNGSAWGSVIAEGIVYVANLKAGPLKDSPVVINMSLGGPALDILEKTAIDYAIAKGVIIVAAAGNSGNGGMGYPGAYAPVISAAASGWKYSFPNPVASLFTNVSESFADYFIAGFSSRQKQFQDLDVAAPGVYILGPYNRNSGSSQSWYFLSGTSLASPHVAGIAALMAQKSPNITGPEMEKIMENAAFHVGAGSTLLLPGFTISWGSDAPGSGYITADAALGGI